MKKIFIFILCAFLISMTIYIIYKLTKKNEHFDNANATSDFPENSIFSNPVCKVNTSDSDLFDNCTSPGYFLSKNYDATNFETIKKTIKKDALSCLEYCDYKSAGSSTSDYSLFVENKTGDMTNADYFNCSCYKTKMNSVPEIIEKTNSQQGVLLGLINYFELKDEVDVYIRNSSGEFLWFDDSFTVVENYSYTCEQFKNEINVDLFSWIENKTMPFYLLKSSPASTFQTDYKNTDNNNYNRKKYQFKIKKVFSNSLDSKFLILPKYFKGKENFTISLSLINSEPKNSYENLNLPFYYNWTPSTATVNRSTATFSSLNPNYQITRKYKVDWVSTNTFNEESSYFYIRPSIYKNHALDKMVNIIDINTNKYLSYRPYKLSPIQAFASFILNFALHMISMMNHTTYKTNLGYVGTDRVPITNDVQKFIDYIKDYHGGDESSEIPDWFKSKYSDQFYPDPSTNNNPNPPPYYHVPNPDTMDTLFTSIQMVSDIIIICNSLPFVSDGSTWTCGLPPTQNNADNLPCANINPIPTNIKIDKYSSNMTFTNTTDNFDQSEFACGGNISFKLYDIKKFSIPNDTSSLGIEINDIANAELDIEKSESDDFILQDYITPGSAEYDTANAGEYWTAYSNYDYGWSDPKNYTICAKWVEPVYKQICTTTKTGTTSNWQWYDYLIPIATIIDAVDGNLEKDVTTTTCSEVLQSSGYWDVSGCYNVGATDSLKSTYDTYCREKYGQHASARDFSGDMPEDTSSPHYPLYALPGKYVNEQAATETLSSYQTIADTMLGGIKFPTTDDNSIRVGCGYPVL